MYYFRLENRCLLIDNSEQMDGCNGPRIESSSEDNGDNMKVYASALSSAQASDMLKYKFN